VVEAQCILIILCEASNLVLPDALGFCTEADGFVQSCWVAGALWAYNGLHIASAVTVFMAFGGGCLAVVVVYTHLTCI